MLPAGWVKRSWKIISACTRPPAKPASKTAIKAKQRVCGLPPIRQRRQRIASSMPSNTWKTMPSGVVPRKPKRNGLEVVLQPLKRLFQPLKIEIAAREGVIRQQHGGKNSRPFPADDFLFGRLD